MYTQKKYGIHFYLFIYLFIFFKGKTEQINWVIMYAVGWE